MSKILSVVIPAYNEEAMLREAAGRVSAVLTGAEIPHELWFVDDGSTDGTWVEICALCADEPRVCGLRFSRNFGKEAAIYAGLCNAGGDCCAVMDCDLQHPPEKLVEMYRLWEQGYEVIEGVKTDRGAESAPHAFAARCFYRLFSRAVHIDMSRASDFKLLDRKAVDVLIRMPERNAFFRAQSAWVGFRTATVPFAVGARTAGAPKWTTRALIRYAVNNIAAFSTAPLQLVTLLGVLMLLISVVLGGVALYQKIAGVALGGFTTVIILQLFTGSVVMISLGVIGYYIAKIYDEVKARPRYVVAEARGERAHASKTVG